MLDDLSELVRGSELARRLASGGSAGVGTRLGKAALNIAAAALLARVLPPSAFGIFLLGQAIVLFGSIAAVLGLEHTLVREIAALDGREGREAVRATLHRAVALTGTGALGVAGLLVVGRDVLLGRLFDEPGLAAMAGWMALWVALEALNRMQVSALRGQHRLAVAAALDGFARALLFLAALIGMAAAGVVTLEAVFVAAALSAGASAAAGGWLLFRAGYGTSPDRSGGREGGLSFRTLWRRSWPLLGATMLGFLINQGDLWLVGIVGASEEAALYGAVLRLTFLVALPLLVLNRTLSSTLAEYHDRGMTEELEAVLRGTTTLVGLATGALVLALLAFGDRVLALVFGTFYGAGTPVLIILLLGQLVFAATGPCGTMLMMAGHERLQLGVSVASGAYLVVGSLWAGSLYGMLGVAAVSASNRMLNNVVTLFLVRRRVGVWSHAYLSPSRIGDGLSRLVRVARRHAG